MRKTTHFVFDDWEPMPPRAPAKLELFTIDVSGLDFVNGTTELVVERDVPSRDRLSSDPAAED